MFSLLYFHIFVKDHKVTTGEYNGIYMKRGCLLICEDVKILNVMMEWSCTLYIETIEVN